MSRKCSICKKEYKELTVCCDVCNDFWSCGRKCLRSADVKEHKKICLRAQQQQQQQNATQNIVHYSIKFKVEDRVFCQTGSTWKTWQSAVITEIRNNRHVQAYLCKLDNGNVCVVNFKDDHNIRPLDFDPNSSLQILFHHMKHKSLDILEEIMSFYSIDLRIIQQKLLFEAVKYNIQIVVTWLFDLKNVNVEICDEKDRNILFHAIIHKQWDFVSFLHNSYSSHIDDLMSVVDSSGMTVLHHLVVANNDEEMSNFFLTGLSGYVTSTYNWFEPDTAVQNTASHMTQVIVTLLLFRKLSLI